MTKEKTIDLHYERWRGCVAWHKFTNIPLIINIDREKMAKASLKQYFSTLDLIQLLQSEHHRVLKTAEETLPQITAASLDAILDCVDQAKKDADKAWRRYCRLTTSQKLLPAPIPKHVFCGGTEVLYAALQQVNSEDPGLIRSYIESGLLKFEY